MKRGWAFVLSLCLLISIVPSSLAAPLRREQAMEITVDAKLQALLDTLVSAAVLRGVETLGNEEAPVQPLVEGVVSMGLMRGVLPWLRGESTNSAACTNEQMAQAYSAFFTTGEYVQITSPLCPCIAIGENGLDFDLAELAQGPFVNASVYRAEFDGETAALLCDLYPVEPENAAQNAQDMQEADFNWLCGAEIYVKAAPESAFGYTVSAFFLSPDYAAGETSLWRTVDNTEYGYTVCLPPILGLSDDTPACYAFETADSSARLTIQCVENMGGYDEALQSFLLESGDEQVEEHREQGFFTAAGSGIYEMVMVPEGLSCGYMLVFVFPPECQTEYTLYAELICNSLMVWGAANG